jgi:hypothetical protein
MPASNATSLRAGARRTNTPVRRAAAAASTIAGRQADIREIRRREVRSMRSKAWVAAVLAALAVAGCGSSDSSGPESSGRSWTIGQFLRLSGLRRANDGLSYRLPTHPECTARVLLRSSAEVDTYKNSGDVIATNPDKSAGIRVETGSPAACKAVFTQALAHLK